MISKKLGFLAAVASAMPVLAEDSPVFVTTGESVRDALTNAIGLIAPMVSAVVVAGIAIWLIPRAVRLIKHAFSSGTGR